jgi:response regulator RpfG family c-di-GMP phosphodiesterase
MTRLRFKILWLFLPLVFVSVTVSGGLSFFQFQTALTRLVNHHLTYKAEQLRDYLYSQWSMVEKLKLQDTEGYRKATVLSFRTYAASLLRQDTERVLVTDAKGRLTDRIALDGLPGGASSVTLPGSGWFSGLVEGAEAVGVSFQFKPFVWTVALVEQRSAYFSPLIDLLTMHLWILLVSICGASTVVWFYVGRVVGPIERLTRAIEEVTTTDELSGRVHAESPDEIGTLADRFNTMLAHLDQRRQAETRARETVSQREVETLYLLARLSETRDEETGLHLMRIGMLSARLSRHLGYDEDEQNLMHNSAPLHDLGKIGVPDAILSKPGKLTPHEFEVMQKHTIYGYELLKDSHSPFLIEGASIALNHHERWDGSGYPNGIAGETIPLRSRIVALVDVFDALLSERPYKRPWSTEDVRAHIRGESGRHFDPRLAQVFDDHYDDLFELFESLSASGGPATFKGPKLVQA